MTKAQAALIRARAAYDAAMSRLVAARQEASQAESNMLVAAVEYAKTLAAMPHKKGAKP